MSLLKWLGKISPPIEAREVQLPQATQTVYPSALYLHYAFILVILLLLSNGRSTLYLTTAFQWKVDTVSSAGSFHHHNHAIPRPPVKATITKQHGRFHVYRKEEGRQARRTSCRSYEKAISKHEEFRLLDEDEDGRLGNQPASLSTKRVGKYIPGPGRGIKTPVTSANSTLSVQKDSVFLQEIAAFINEKTSELPTREKHQVSIQSQVLSKVMEAIKHNQDATMSLLLSKAGIRLFLSCVQNRSQNSLRRSQGRGNSFLLNSVLHV